MGVATVLLLRPASPNEFAASLRDLLTSAPRTAAAPTLQVVEHRADDQCAAADELARLLRSEKPDICLVVLNPPLLAQADALLPLVNSASPSTRVVVGLEGGEPDQMARLYELGAADFITAPLRAVDILPRVWRLAEEAAHRRREPGGWPKQLIGENAEFLAEVSKIPTMARCDASVLLLGETGTGKELCARAIHYLSPRASRPFVPINCGAIPTELVENELFGHERGAFTGATGARSGLIREAEGGTLFLDEVDCLPSQAQVKLLRFLQDKEYKPLGSTKFCRADVRVVAATNANCRAALESGRLRQDLYYRLNVIPLKLPPLRERREDIRPLACHFLATYAAEFAKPARGFTAEALQALVSYDWPGNVRELEHVVERAVIFSDQPLIKAADIVLTDAAEPPRQQSFKEAKSRVITRFERAYILDLLLANNGNVSRAARAAHKNRRALWELIRKHHIDVDCLRASAK
ncbi:MAG TPA: sigma-54 dependent transcriptional regulator [Pyrinomonadaceae bacterium]|nr:sigma-54 dependent transcriptional regulator [Pyrinomonadaceae bacterium]